MPECRTLIPSENVADFIVRYNGSDLNIFDGLENFCVQKVNDRYLILYLDAEEIEKVRLKNFSYTNTPKLYGLMDTTAVADTGALRLQNQTSLNLTGSDVIIGFIDTGIEYTRDEFRYTTGQTRVIGIWDQTDNSGNTPQGLDFGSEYTREDINRALESENPYELVPSRDTNGHGTFMASITCGTYNEQRDFIGVAPNSLIAMVKLKEAKNYLKELYFIQGEEPAFQENDIMLALTYLHNLQQKYRKPMVYVVGLGSGNGARVGHSPLGEVLTDFGSIVGSCALTCTGNEGSARLHYSGIIQEGGVEDVEFRVGEDNPGFVLELWANAPDIFSVGFVSPLGESIPRIAAKKDVSATVNFLIEGTSIQVDVVLVESGSGRELISMRFIDPSPGIWIIRVYGTNILSGRYNIWGNLRMYMEPDSYFLKPDPEITLTEPGATEEVISVGGYNHIDNSIYPMSGRGFSANGNVEPDIVAPSVNVFGADIGTEGFIRRTGTSVAAALTAGCCAQMLEWGIVKGNEPYMKTNLVKNYLIRGALRDRDILYPNPQWGYGKLDVYNTFVILTTT